MRIELTQAVAYPIADRERLNRFLMLFLLGFVPLLGQVIVAGYLLRVARLWYEGESQRLPDFTDFGALVLDGFMLILAGVIYLVPAAAMFFIPAVGPVLSVAWCLLVMFIFPVPVAKYAVSRNIGEFFAVKSIVVAARDRLFGLLKLFGIAWAILLILLLPPAIFALAGNGFYQCGAGPLWQFIGAVSIVVGILAEMAFLLIGGHIFFALAGQVLRGEEE